MDRTNEVLHELNDMDEFAGCCEVKVETFGDLTLKTLSLTLASWSTT